MIKPKYRPAQKSQLTKNVITSVIDRLATCSLKTHPALTPTGQASLPTVLAVRGYFRDGMGKVGRNDRGIYDDAIFIKSAVDDNVFNFNANVDPSVHRYKVASLIAPQTLSFKLGYHGYTSKFGHPAFRQASSVTFNRDGVTKTLTDAGKPKIWTNLHKGGWGVTSSLGCITIPPSQWSCFYNRLKSELERSTQLFDVATVPTILLEYQGTANLDPFKDLDYSQLINNAV